MVEVHVMPYAGAPGTPVPQGIAYESPWGRWYAFGGGVFSSGGPHLTSVSGLDFEMAGETYTPCVGLRAKISCFAGDSEIEFNDHAIQQLLLYRSRPSIFQPDIPDAVLLWDGEADHLLGADQAGHTYELEWHFSTGAWSVEVDGAQVASGVKLGVSGDAFASIYCRRGAPFEIDSEIPGEVIVNYIWVYAQEPAEGESDSVRRTFDP